MACTRWSEMHPENDVGVDLMAEQIEAIEGESAGEFAGFDLTDELPPAIDV